MSGPEWQRVTDALTRHLLACENDASADVLTACDGDAALAAQVRAVLADAPPFLARAPVPTTLQVLGVFELLEQRGGDWLRGDGKNRRPSSACRMPPSSFPMGVGPSVPARRPKSLPVTCQPRTPATCAPRPPRCSRISGIDRP
jgi:hypothetical protein